MKAIVRTPKRIPLLASILVVLALALPAQAESAAELLEQGLYTEQTVGDLGGAIEIYSKIIDDDAANRPHVAQARFRLGVCHAKAGDDTAAREAFETLIRDFPEQERWVAKAKERLAAVRPDLGLRPVPWHDGELLRYRISLATGKTVGSLVLTAESTSVDGIDAWRLSVYRIVLTAHNNFGVSRTTVDAATQRPIHSKVRHGFLGDADATYGTDSAEVTTGGKTIRQPFDQEVFDNEQAMHLMRMLPLEIGYSTTLSLLPTWTGKVIDTRLDVPEETVCEVPAGEFPCFVVTTDIGQTTWYSTGAERYPVMLEHGGVTIELTEVGRFTSGAPVAFGLDDFDFTGTLPADWQTHVHRTPGKTNMAMIRLVDPEATSISAVEVYRCPERGCPDLQRIARRELEGAQERFAGYTLRDDGWRERQADGRPVISFAADYQQDGQPWVQYRNYTIDDGLLFESIFRTPADEFAALRDTFDGIVDSLTTH